MTRWTGSRDAACGVIMVMPPRSGGGLLTTSTAVPAQARQVMGVVMTAPFQFLKMSHSEAMGHLDTPLKGGCPKMSHFRSLRFVPLCPD